MSPRAAVLWEAGQQWQIEDLVLDAPQHGEVKVDLAASGLCHSDKHRDGSIPSGLNPSSAVMRKRASLPTSVRECRHGPARGVGPGARRRAASERSPRAAT